MADSTAPPTMRPRDRRRTCWCTHRYRDHFWRGACAAPHCDCPGWNPTLPALPKPRKTLEARFWEKVKTDGACWLWQGTRGGSLGYGMFRGPSRKPEFAHRVAWQITHGPIPEGLMVLHRCDVPPCVRPAHLYLGTATDNSRDMTESMRVRGQRVPKGAKRTYEPANQVLTVRLSLGMLKKLDEICAREDINHSDAVRRSLELYHARNLRDAA